MTSVLFLHSNRPVSLPALTLSFLNRSLGYEAAMLYSDRPGSAVRLPMTGLLHKAELIRVERREGAHRLAKPLEHALSIRKVIEQIRLHRPQVLHAWHLDMLVAARLATLRDNDITILSTLMDTTPLLRNPAFIPFQRWLYRRVAHVFVTSPRYGDRFLRRHHLIPPTVPVTYVPNVPPSKMFADFRPRELQGPFTIGFVGFLRGLEGIRMLLDAALDVRRRGHDVRLLFAGVGIATGLVQQIAIQHDFVEYSGPYVHDTDIAAIYSKVDALYAIFDRSPDKRDAMAYRLCESVNCQLPIIVAEDSYMAEVVLEHGVGVVVAIGDAASLSKAIIGLLTRRGQIEGIRQNCRQVRHKFVFEHYQEDIAKAYRSLCSRDEAPVLAGIEHP